MRVRSVPLALAALLVSAAASAQELPQMPGSGPAPLPPPGVAPPPAPAQPAQPKPKAAPKAAPAPEPQQAAPATAAPTPQSTTQDPRKGITPFVAKTLKGSAAYLARDFAGAVTAFREAIQEDPQDPLGHYLLGEAQLAAGNLGEAEASWQNGLRLAASSEGVNAKLLFVMADLRERQGKYGEAKKAWDDYGAFVASHPQAKGFAEIAPERAKVVDARQALVAKYEPVKLRIAQREKELSAPPPDDGPQGPSKPAPKAAPAPQPAAPAVPKPKKNLPF